MKIINILGAVIFMTAGLFAQAPQKMSYQAVIRNGANALVQSQTVGMQISILQGSASGTAVYVETHSATTNANGLVSIEIGGGIVTTGSFAVIDWANGPFFIKTETDPAGGTNYTISGTTQLLSVPYAMYAGSSGSSIPGPQGPAGPAGATGPQGTAGNDGAPGPQGPIGLTGPAGPQGATGTNGTNGTDGKTVLNGASNPTALDGNHGDFYINTVTNTIFGPKAAGAWPATGVSLVGPQGATGATGATGPQGPTGQTGATGATGPQGPAGIGGFTHYIGEQFGGGVIFHLWKDALGVEHGLIVDKTDLSTAQVWSNIDQIGIGTPAQSSWDGLSNSNAIVGQSGHTSSAAAMCLVSTNGGQSDWYLPSIDELTLLSHNRFNVNKTLLTIGGATVLPATALYWSSSELNSATAWFFIFGLGIGDNFDKFNLLQVRAVRAF
jgi:hypothetical protein